LEERKQRRGRRHSLSPIFFFWVFIDVGQARRSGGRIKVGAIPR